MKRSEISIKDFLAIIKKCGNILAVVAKVGKKCNRAAEILFVFNVDIRTVVNAQLIGKFRLREMQIITSKQKTISKIFTEFTESGIVFGNLQGNPTSLSSKFLKILTKKVI